MVMVNGVGGVGGLAALMGVLVGSNVDQVEDQVGSRLKTLRLNFSKRVDRRTVEKVLAAAGSHLGGLASLSGGVDDSSGDSKEMKGLEALEVRVPAFAGERTDEALYKIISMVIPRYRRLRTLLLHVKDAQLSSGASVTTHGTVQVTVDDADNMKTPIPIPHLVVGDDARSRDEDDTPYPKSFAAQQKQTQNDDTPTPTSTTPLLSTRPLTLFSDSVTSAKSPFSLPSINTTQFSIGSLHDSHDETVSLQAITPTATASTVSLRLFPAPPRKDSSSSSPVSDVPTEDEHQNVEIMPSPGSNEEIEVDSQPLEEGHVDNSNLVYGIDYYFSPTSTITGGSDKKFSPISSFGSEKDVSPIPPLLSTSSGTSTRSSSKRSNREKDGKSGKSLTSRLVRLPSLKNLKPKKEKTSTQSMLSPIPPSPLPPPSVVFLPSSSSAGASGSEKLSENGLSDSALASDTSLPVKPAQSHHSMSENYKENDGSSVADSWPSTENHIIDGQSILDGKKERFSTLSGLSVRSNISHLSNSTISSLSTTSAADAVIQEVGRAQLTPMRPTFRMTSGKELMNHETQDPSPISDETEASTYLRHHTSSQCDQHEGQVPQSYPSDRVEVGNQPLTEREQHRIELWTTHCPTLERVVLVSGRVWEAQTVSVTSEVVQQKARPEEKRRSLDIEPPKLELQLASQLDFGLELL